MYKSAEVKEHAFQAFSKLLKSEQLPVCVLLCGPETLLVDWALDGLKKRIVNPACESLDLVSFSDEDVTEADIIAACETLPLMSERKLVVVKKDPADLPEISDYIAKLPESCVLCFVCDAPDKRKASFKAADKYGRVFDFTSLDEQTLGAWGAKKLSAMGKSASSRDIVRFAYDAGYFDKERNYGLYNLENDLKKAAALYDGAQISFEQLSEISSGQSETAVFKLLDCAFSNRKGEALQLLNNTVKAEMPSKQISAILRFHGLLCSQLEIMVEARERREAGQDKGTVKSEMGINPYRLDKALAASERQSLKRLKAALAEAYKIEEDIKSGKLAAKLAMELFIAKL